eukprot:scaffold58522_cov32-Tisochrysis_lutea.AAC.1
MGDVVVLSKSIVLPVHDCKRADQWADPALLIELNEGVETPVYEREEGGHGQQRLQPCDEEEPRATCDQAEQKRRNHPEHHHTPPQQRVLPSHPAELKVA